MILLLCASLAASPVGVDLLFPRNSGDPARLRLEFQTDGKPVDERWGKFLDQLFRYADRNSDGSLSKAEAERVITLPRPNVEPIRPDFARMDADSDKAVSLAEFRGFYRQAGFTPVVVLSRRVPAADLRAGEALFRHLDRNNDGTVSAAELADAPRLLRKLDEDEDERIDRNEVTGTGPSIAATDVWPAVDLQSAKRPDAVLTLSLHPKPAAPIVTKNDDFVPLAVKAFGFTCPGSTAIVAVPPSDTAISVREMRSFLLAQFGTLTDGKSALSRTDAEQDTASAGLVGLFDAADRDSDNKLSLAELTAFLDLLESGASCQIVVTATDAGRNLFDLLDANADGRLDHTELAAASKLVGSDGKKDLLPRTVPRKLILTAAYGSAGTKFGPVTFGTRSGSTKLVPAAPAATGPKWFRAQDRNGDGFLSPSEFVGPPELFKRLDANADGRISVTEAERVTSSP